MSSQGLGKKKNPVRHRTIIRDSIYGLTKPAIQRLMLKAGVEQFGGHVHDEIRLVIKVNMEAIIKNSVAIMSYSQVNTMTNQHIEVALASLGISVIVPSGKYETSSLSVKKRDAVTRNLQKESEKLIFPRLPFNRLIREVSQDYLDNIRFSSDSLDLLQIVIEALMLDILKNSNIITTAAGRKTLVPRDIQVARHIMKNRTKLV